MSNDTQKTIGHAGIYTIGNILRNIISIIMLPIYTRYLTPSDYGILELLSMMLDFVGIILGMRIGEAIFRFYSTTSDELEKKQIISSSLILAMTLNALGVIILLSLSQPLAAIMFGDAALHNYVALFSFVLLLQALSETCLIVLMAEQKPWQYIGVSITKLIIQLSLNIYLVVILQMHVEGVIYSTLTANILITIFLLFNILRKTGIHFSLNKIRKLVSFSTPLMLAQLGAFYLTFGDRYFLRIFGNLNEIGIYALGYKFGFMLTMLTWDPFEKIWATQRYEIHKKMNSIHLYQQSFMLISTVMIFFALGIALFVKDVLRIMSDQAFWSAYKIVPIILVAYILQSWTTFCNFGILLKGNTLQITYGAIIAVIVITIAYITLIPSYGIHGAAWATLAGFLARFLWINYVATHAYNMMLPWHRVSLLGGWATLVFILSFLSPADVLSSILARIVLVFVFLAGLYLLPIYDRSTRGKLWEATKNPGTIRGYFN